jgi:hypothetical protein
MSFLKREMAAISIPAILHIFTGTWYGIEGFLKGPRGDLIGQIVLGVGGVCSFLVGAYYWIDSNVQVRQTDLHFDSFGLNANASPRSQSLALRASSVRFLSAASFCG